TTRAYVKTQRGPASAQTSLGRDIADALSSPRRDAGPSFWNLRGAQAGTAQSPPAAKRNRNRLVVGSSVCYNLIADVSGARGRQHLFLRYDQYSGKEAQLNCRS